MSSIGALCFDADDKYVKAMMKNSGAFSKYIEAAICFGKGLALVCRNSFLAYGIFVMAGYAMYHHWGGNLAKAAIQSQLEYASAVAEALGLLVLRSKIIRQGSVTGVSGMTMIMYALVYVLREAVLMPHGNRFNYVDAWAMTGLQLAPVFIVMDILRSVFKTYRSSYQEDLDIVRIKYLVPGCLALAAVLHPELGQVEGNLLNISWTACLYLDVMALMPQVAMMAQSGGKVEAPISHFVAATALSRMVDLWYWCVSFTALGRPGELNFSGGLIIAVHVVHLLLVTDFIYYYLKARVSGSALSEDLSVGIDSLC